MSKKGCVLDLRLDDESGTSAHDYSRYGNDGTLTGCKWVENGLEFNGTSDYVDCGNDASLNCVDAITLSAWVNFSSFPSYSAIITKTGSNLWNKYVGLILVDNDVRFWVNAWNTNFAVYTNLKINTLYHIVGSYDKSAGVIQIYVNGIEGTPDAYAGNIFYDNSDLLIGVSGDLTSWSYNGTISNPQICNYALSAAEIYDYYESTKHRYK